MECYRPPLNINSSLNRNRRVSQLRAKTNLFDVTRAKNFEYLTLTKKIAAARSQRLQRQTYLNQFAGTNDELLHTVKDRVLESVLTSGRQFLVQAWHLKLQLHLNYSGKITTECTIHCLLFAYIHARTDTSC